MTLSAIIIWGRSLNLMVSAGPIPRFPGVNKVALLRASGIAVAAGGLVAADCAVCAVLMLAAGGLFGKYFQSHHTW